VWRTLTPFDPWDLLVFDAFKNKHRELEGVEKCAQCGSWGGLIYLQTCNAYFHRTHQINTRFHSSESARNGWIWGRNWRWNSWNWAWKSGKTLGTSRNRDLHNARSPHIPHTFLTRLSPGRASLQIRMFITQLLYRASEEKNNHGLSVGEKVAWLTPGFDVSWRHVYVCRFPRLARTSYLCTTEIAT